MKLLSIQVGRPQPLPFGKKLVSSAIHKSPVAGPVMVRRLNLEGDEQADLRVHGGYDKAVYAYGADAYPAWEATRPQDTFGMGAMGENLTFDQLNEAQMYIGDIYELGGARLQVTQPRLPCFKLGIKFHDPKIVVQFNEIHRSGVYFRVVQEGMIEAGQRLELKTEEAARVSIAELFTFYTKRSIDTDRARVALSMSCLPEFWRESLQSFLE